jgi:hypothetical protein
VRSPGNVAELKLSLKTDVLEHYESQTGQRSLDHRMVKQKSATVNLTIEEFTKENLALALYGNHVVGTPGTVTNEPIGGATPWWATATSWPTPRCRPGRQGFSRHAGDAGRSWAPTTPPTRLRCDPVSGRYHRFTAPFKASYAYGVATEIGIFTQPLPERFLRWRASTPPRATPRCWSSLYRVAFDPLKEISFISDEYNKFELEGSLLADSTKPFDAVLGQFGRIVQL